MKIGVIRIRGSIRVRKRIKDTLNMLRLYNKNYCVVVENKPSIMGMIKKIKDYTTYGEIDEDTLKLLFEKRGEEFKEKTWKEDNKKYSKFIVYNNKKYKKHFRLNMPRKGYGRKGTKKSFSEGGALGYRGKKINDLIRRMV